MTIPPLLPAELREIGERHYGGHGWQTRLAADPNVAVSPRSVRYWVTGRYPVPDAVAIYLRQRDGRSVTLALAPPPATLRPEDDRDGPCADLIEPILDTLLAQSVALGWSPAEIVAATLGWAIHAAADGAGKTAARELLARARESLDIRQD